MKKPGTGRAGAGVVGGRNLVGREGLDGLDCEVAHEGVLPF
jgi:hypothetical protein